MSGLRVISETLGGSPLARAAVAGNTPSDWYLSAPKTVAEWVARANEVRREQSSGHDWVASLQPAFNAQGAALDRLQRSACGAGVVITTGQQPGLFGGPLYTLSKALSARAFADELERRTGIPVAPVFWAATDDADAAEANSTLVAASGGAQTITLQTHALPGTPLANVPLGDVAPAFNALAAAAGSGSHPRYLELVRSSYASAESVGDAYVALMRGLLEPLGIAVLDASHAAVRNAADPLLRRALRSAPDVDVALRERHKALSEAGFDAQVALVKGLSLVFATEQGIKRRLPVAEAAGAESGVPHGMLSANVLLRPVVERAILPTTAYMAGPGEIAYFAQVSAVADALGAAQPLVLPRWSGTVIEPHIRRLLERYRLEPDDLRDPHAAETRFAREAMPSHVAETLKSLRVDMADRVKSLQTAETPADQLLPDAVLEGARRMLEHRVDRLERRLMAAQKRRSAAALTDIATARGALYPGGKRQERALNSIPMLTRHGDAVIDDMLAQARQHAATLIGSDHQQAPRST